MNSQTGAQSVEESGELPPSRRDTPMTDGAMDHNPFLKPWRRPQPSEIAGKGSIEVPDTVENLTWQTRPAPPTEYENRLGDALEACFEEGIEALGPLVERLNEMGVYAPDGSPWTETSFEREMQRLGG